MKTSTLEVNKLLDKLYNLRGSDSVIFKEMEKLHDEAEATKERTTEEKGALQEKIAGLKEDSKNLEEQGKDLITVLSGIDKSKYETVIERLNISFDPEALLNNLSDVLPKTIENIEKDIKESEESLVKVEEEMNSAITTIEELGIRKDQAKENQDKLNEYFDLALKGNINITREAITSLLEQFGLSEEEIREAAKILMFPEDALFDYDERYHDLSKKSISEVIQEARSQEVNNVEDTSKVEEAPKEEVLEETVVKDENTAREDLSELFTELGIDTLDYTNSDLDEVLAHYDENVIRRNVNIFKKNSLNLDLFVDNLNLLYDKELEAKMDRLMRVGKTAIDIYLNPDVLTKYDYRGLDKAIILLQSSGLDPKKVPLMAY